MAKGGREFSATLMVVGALSVALAADVPVSVLRVSRLKKLKSTPRTGVSDTVGAKLTAGCNAKPYWLASVFAKLVRRASEGVVASRSAFGIE